MPEGHVTHRLAREHAGLFARRPVRVSSPQGRFTEGAALLDGLTLSRTDAHGKHLFYSFGPHRLHVHLGLIGKFSVGSLPVPEPVGQVRLRMVGESAYVDLRGATIVEVITPGEVRAILDRLGPDPLRSKADSGLAWKRIHRSSLPIGRLLMDQSVLSGVGNVFRAEVLFRHGISPFTPGNHLDEATWLAMWEDLTTLMRAGVRAGRIVTTERTDRSRRTGPAKPEDAHYVYRRTGLPCRRCGGEVRTEELDGRNLHWCPTCQQR